jgi:hypothetical protein
VVSNRNSNTVSVLRNLSNVAAAPTIQPSGPAVLGQTMLLELTSPVERAQDFLVLLGVATTLPIVLPDNRTIPLADSSLLLLPGAGGGVFVDGIGVLDGVGAAYTRFLVPSVPQLSGLTLYFSFAVLDPRASFGIGGIADARAVTLQ